MTQERNLGSSLASDTRMVCGAGETLNRQLGDLITSRYFCHSARRSTACRVLTDTAKVNLHYVVVGEVPVPHPESGLKCTSVEGL